MNDYIIKIFNISSILLFLFQNFLRIELGVLPLGTVYPVDGQFGAAKTESLLGVAQFGR